MRKPTFWFQTWSAVQLQKMARGLKFRIQIVEEVYYLCSENKGADLRLCFRICKTLVSHDAAHIISDGNRPEVGCSNLTMPLVICS